MATLRRLGEFPFIEAVAAVARGAGVRRGVKVGIGDDAAVVSASPDTLLTTDIMTEGVHFRREWLTPSALGRRAFRVAVSDIAAMGGRARFVLLSLSLPGDYEASAARALVRGLASDAAAVGAALVGGNVSAGPVASIGVTVIGEPSCGTRRTTGRSRSRVPGGPVLRSGARVGDIVLVTGSLGDAAAGVSLLEAGKRRGRLIDAYRCPPLRLDVGAAFARTGAVHSMLDVSDGLLQDLSHIAHASAVSIRLDTDALPISRSLARGVRDPGAFALAGGDDYELLLTADSSAVRRLVAAAKRLDAPLTAIGSVQKRGAFSIVDREGRPVAARGGGYRHFESGR